MPVFRAGLPGKQDHFFGAAALRIGIRDQLQPGALQVHRPKSATSRPACSSAVRTMCAFSNMASVLWPTQRPAPEFVHATQIPALYHGIWLPVTVLFPQRPWGRNLPSCGRRTASGEEDNVIRIGAIGPMTGGSAIYGEGAQNAIEMAVEEINADDSSPYTIEIVNGGEIADDAQDARQAYACRAGVCARRRSRAAFCKRQRRGRAFLKRNRPALFFAVQAWSGQAALGCCCCPRSISFSLVSAPMAQRIVRWNPQIAIMISAGTPTRSIIVTYAFPCLLL